MAANSSILTPHFKLESWAEQMSNFAKMSEENAETYKGRQWTLLKNLFEKVTDISFNPSSEKAISFLELMVYKIRAFLHDNKKIWNAKQDLIHLQTLKNGLNNSPIADTCFIIPCIKKIESIIEAFSIPSKGISSSSSFSFVSRLKPIDAEINGSIPTPGGVNRYYIVDNPSICDKTVLTIFLSVGIGYVNIKTAEVIGELAGFDMNRLQIMQFAEIAGNGSVDQIEYFAKKLVLHLHASSFKDVIQIFINQTALNPSINSKFALQLLIYEVYYHASSHSIFLVFLNQLMNKKNRPFVLPPCVLELAKTLERRKTSESILAFIESYFTSKKDMFSPILIAHMIRDFVAKNIPRSSIICQIEDTDIAEEISLERIRKSFPNNWEIDPLFTNLVQEMTRFGTRWIWRFLLNVRIDHLVQEISNRLYKLIPCNVRIIDELTPNVKPGGSNTYSRFFSLCPHPREQLLGLLLTSDNLEAVALRGGGELYNLNNALLTLSRNLNVCNIRELHIFADTKNTKYQREETYRITLDQLQATLCSPAFKHLKDLFICNPSEELINYFDRNLPFQLNKLTLFFAPDDDLYLPILFKPSHDDLMINLANSELLNVSQIVRIGYLYVNAENLLPLINSLDFSRWQELTIIGDRVERLEHLLKASPPTSFGLEIQKTKFLSNSANLVKLKRDYIPAKKQSRWKICSILSNALASSCYHLWMRFGPSCG